MGTARPPEFGGKFEGVCREDQLIYLVGSGHRRSPVSSKKATARLFVRECGLAFLWDQQTAAQALAHAGPFAGSSALHIPSSSA